MFVDYTVLWNASFDLVWRSCSLKRELRDILVQKKKKKLESRMGQKFSRSIVGRLEKGMQQYRKEMDKDIMRTIEEKKRQAAPGGFTDPNALQSGFTRGMSPSIRQDMEQQVFLESQQHPGTKNNPNQEMPEDLINFLQDMGPVTRNKAVPRLRKHQQEELERIDRDSRRELRDMPIMEETKFTTSRTTSFSRKVEQEKFGVTGRELHQLLLSSNMESTIAATLEQNGVDKAERNIFSDLLRNSIKYLEVPVIMKDTDDTYVGAWPDRVDDLKLMKLTVVPESQVRLLLAVEDTNRNTNPTPNESDKSDARDTS